MIFFLAFFPAFIWDKTENTISQIYILGILFMIVSFITFSGIAILAGSISTYLKQNRNIGFILKWLQIIVFVGIAAFILVP
jgi:threonine/homoserine/homoserine lactone efflux protein